jgi:bifunctional UDP-N-acetylglucosamine pyrophosphorylase/glucosamine-1-phosphate N-acetyltransferase
MKRSLDSWVAVILAAGRGKRMRSSLPKLLHPLCGRPVVRYVAEATLATGLRPIIVVGRDGGDMRSALGESAEYVVQTEPLGTGHAVSQAREAAGGAEHLLVLNGDVPLITPETLRRLIDEHEGHHADLTFLTARLDAAEYGLVQRDAAGRVAAVVEAAALESAVEGEAEINSGQYCFRAAWLWAHLAAIPRATNGEQYLTSLVAMAVNEGAAVATVRVSDPDEVRGINDREQLAEAEAALRRRINRSHMLAGVTIVDPATAYIDAGVTIGADTVIDANTQLRGATRVGRECRIGPNCTLRDATVGDRCRIDSSTVEEATLEEDVEVGPYSHLRPGAYLGANVHIGNFAEVKNARLGRGVKMGHFSYVGDADIGEETNIGAGAITCNFDGERKQRTIIGRGVFIGSDTMLVAPVTIGDGARTAAGSVVTKDVPAGALAAGAPARIVRGTQERDVS